MARKTQIVPSRDVKQTVVVPGNIRQEADRSSVRLPRNVPGQNRTGRGKKY